MAASSLLFVPADRPERIAKALAAGAGAVIVDLEDAVGPQSKDAARQQLAQWLATAGDARVVVRVNGVATPWFAQDIALCASPAVVAVMLPKAESAADIARAATAAKAVLPLIETAQGFDRMREIGAAPRVERLVFGTIDFQVDMGIEGEGEELLFFRSQMVLASRLAGIKAPCDGVSTALDAPDALRAESLRARRLGFGAKLCIHPKQVAVVNAAFAPSEEELAWARRVLDVATQSGGAAVALDGKMVDAPVIARARSLLQRSGVDGTA